MAHIQAIVDMAAIAKAAAVAEAVLDDDGVRLVVHERVREPPAALIEVASSADIVARVGHMAAMGQAADSLGLVARRDEIVDQRFKTIR